MTGVRRSISCVCVWFRVLIIVLIAWLCFFRDSFDGYTRVRKPSSLPFSRVCLTLRYFVRNCFIVNPRKLKPARPVSLRLGSRVCEICVLLGFSSRPMLLRNVSVSFLHCFTISRDSCIMRMSSAYLMYDSALRLSLVPSVLPLGSLIVVVAM